MTASEIVITIIIFALSGVCAFLSARHFAEKGFLLNNAYIWASEKERESMDKKPHYRQSAIVFCFLSAVLLVIGISTLLKNSKILLIEIPLLIGVLIYAIISSIKIEKNAKK